MPVKMKDDEEIKACMKPGDVIAFSSNGLFSTAIKLVTSSHVSHVGIVVPSECLEGADPDDIVIAEATEKGVEFRSLDSRVRDSDVEMLWWLPLSTSVRTRLNVDAFRESVCAHRKRDYDYLQAAMLGLTLLEPALNAIDPELDDAIREFLLNELSRGQAANNPSLGENIRPGLLNMLGRALGSDNGNQILHDVIRLLLEGGKREAIERQIENQEDFENFFCSELVTKALVDGGALAGVNASGVTPIDLCRFNLYEKEYVQFKGKERTRIRGFNSVNPSKWEE